MIVHDVEQGSRQWHNLRLGIPTASCFGRILTPGGLKFSKGAYTYRNELLAEWLIGEPAQDLPNDWMIRGTAMEREAVKWYEFDRDVTCEEVGFVTDDNRKVGCSPDRLVGTDGGLEIKCPAPGKCVGIILGDGSETHDYRCQVQGCLWVTGREWWDLMVYHPDLDPVIVRFEPDPEWVEAWELYFPEFLALLEEGKRRLLAAGMTPREVEYEEPVSAGVCADCGTPITVEGSKRIGKDRLCGPCYGLAVLA